MKEEAGSLGTIRRGYADQLVYYKNNMGKKSDYAGVIISKKLVKTVEKRYQQLGGNLIKLYSGLELPLKNENKTRQKENA